ncbi:DHH family phosphoesterase [Robiginitalea sp.]|uniref:DHH family phosphoesterase n=1 Tax=Robiginitalea sp. TaxID=1902411 RepID=UPI003C739559
MNSDLVGPLKALLKTEKRIVLVPHKNPDGDAIGSCLGLQRFFEAHHHTTHLISPNDFPEFLKWMPGAETVINFEKNRNEAEKIIASADLIFTLDFNALNRTGAMQEALEKATCPFVMVDHHQSPENYAEVTYSDAQMSSTCEMVYHLIDRLGAASEIDAEIATCLYTGILTDTGSFKYPGTTPTTMRVTAELMERGARHTQIHRYIYDTNRVERLQLLGCALQNLVILKPYRTAYITLTQEDLNRHNFQKGDTEGFVNYALSLKDVVLAAIFIENKEEGIVKISLRSQGDFSVNDLARSHFNGGGHINAAGGRSDESLEATTARFERILPLYEKQLNR